MTNKDGLEEFISNMDSRKSEINEQCGVTKHHHLQSKEENSSDLMQIEEKILGEAGLYKNMEK